jgi:hypothetical protein
MGRPLHSPQQRVRPFIPPGKGSSPVVLLQAQLPDLLQGLDAALSKDWPRSFIKVWMSSSSALVRQPEQRIKRLSIIAYHAGAPSSPTITHSHIHVASGTSEAHHITCKGC